MGLAKPLHLRLFLEGQEVPVISAQVAVNLFAPATAAIQVVPLPEVLALKPRTMVHLFFLEEPLMRNGESGRASLADLRRADGMDTAFSDQAYKLLFCGEFAGFSYVKTPMSRAVVLQCLDFSSYWDFLQATMLEYGPQGNAFTHRASLYASNTALFADIPGSEPSVRLRQWILSKPKTPGLDNVGGLAGGILALMEIMGGLRNHTLGVNDFFTLAELRCHILGQVSAEDGDNTAQRLLDVSIFFDWLFSSLQTQSGQISLRDMFKLLCQYVYYSVVPNPVAKYDPNIKNKPVSVPPRTSKLVQAKEFPAILSAAQDTVQQLVSSPVQKGAAQTALINIRDSALPRLKKLKGIDPSVTKKAESLSSLLTDLVATFDEAKVNSDPAYGARRIEEKRNGAFNAAQALAATLQDAADSDVTTAGYKTTVNELSRLRTQIFRPDCYMAAPPTCNVIFPEQYTQLSYDRSLIDEVSRVGILTYIRALNAQDPLLGQHFLAPSLWDEAAGVAKQIKNQWRVLMDHELHTGIVAKEEWLPDSFQIRHANTEGMKKASESTIKWQQRVGMHHFFKYRVGPRTLNVAGRFMPYLVAGFPALVIQEPFYLADTGSDESVIERIRASKNPAEELGSPPQFLGMIEGLSHSVGQDGGHTQVSMSHARVHVGIDDEFVGLALAKTKMRGYSTKLVRHYLTYDQAKKDEKKLAFLREITPQANPGVDKLVVDKKLSAAEASYNVKSVKNGVETLTKKTVAVKSTKETTKGKKSTPTSESTTPSGRVAKVPNGGTITVGSKGLYGTVKLIEVLPPEMPTRMEDGQNYFKSVIVYEEINIPTGEAQDVPFEYVVQPDWLSTSYDNENVGKKVYQPFFGCGSIVDQLQLSDSGQIVPRDPDGTVVLPGEETKALMERIQKIEAQKGLISIEKAVNVIAYLYGKVRSEHLDVDEFVESFVRRPVATKRDLLGAWDLEFKVQGGKVVISDEMKTKVGFHTFSVHPLCVEAKNLTGLMDDPAIKLSSSLDKNQRASMQAAYDVRWQKLEMVMKYKRALEAGARGFVG